MAYNYPDDAINVFADLLFHKFPDGNIDVRSELDDVNVICDAEDRGVDNAESIITYDEIVDKVTIKLEEKINGTA